MSLCVSLRTDGPETETRAPRGGTLLHTHTKKKEKTKGPGRQASMLVHLGGAAAAGVARDMPDYYDLAVREMNK